MNYFDEVLETMKPFLPLYFITLFKSIEFMAFSMAFLASMGTFVGGILVILMGNWLNLKDKGKNINYIVGLFQSFSAGVMLYMTFFDLIPESVSVLGQSETLIWFFIGCIIFYFIETFIPEEIYVESKGKDKKTVKQEQMSLMLRSSLLTYTCLFLHNLPEGLSVYLSTLSNPKLGAQLALGIMMHNIPEGMAVAIPMWAATRSTSYVLGMTLLNGLAEPIGVIIGGFFLQNYLSKYVLSRCLAVVGGIMAYISLYELFPSGVLYCGKRVASNSLFLGMGICFLVLEIVELFINH